MGPDGPGQDRTATTARPVWPDVGGRKACRISPPRGDDFAPAASGDARVHVANPRDQAERGVAAADPQSYITADDRRLGGGVSDPGPARQQPLLLADGTPVRALLCGVQRDQLRPLRARLYCHPLGRLAAVENGGGAFRAVTIIDLLVTAALLVMFLFMPIPALLGQWSRMLTFQAPAAGSALDRVRQAMERHATPHDNLGLRALSPPARDAATTSRCATGISPDTSLRLGGTVEQADVFPRGLAVLAA